MKTDIAGMFLAAAWAGTCPSVCAQWSSQQDARIYPSPNGLGYGDEFGGSCALDGGTLVVGSRWHDPRSQGDHWGAAFVFRESAGSWAQEALLSSSSYDPDEFFGHAVAVDGDTAVVSSPADTTGSALASGAVYVFERQGTAWIETARLVASDATTFDRFGSAVSLRGDRLAVGAMYDNAGAGTFSGSAYVFVRSGGAWIQEAKLVPTTGAANDLFGLSIALDGDRVAVGAPWRDSGGLTNCGAVVLFERAGSSWSEVRDLLSPQPEAAAQFGSAVALDGGTLLVGAPLDDAAGTNAGAAYVFTGAGALWTLEARLTDFGSVFSDNFGSSVDLEGDRAVVGLPLSAIPGVATGAAQLFVREGSQWSGAVEMVGSDCEGGDYLGSSVAISGDRVAAGAPGGETPPAGLATGEAYVFRIVPPPFVAAYCVGKQNSQGCTPAMSWIGLPSASNPNTFALTCSQVINFQPGMLFYGFQSAAIPFGGGTLCVTGLIARTSIQNSLGNSPPPADCSGAYSFDMNAHIQGGIDPLLVAGASVFAQYWYRDPGSSSGIGLSDAVEFEIAP